MRLSEKEREAIQQTARKFFGEQVRVYLFGSRADDMAKGGDIDLLLEGVDETADLFSKKADMLVTLKRLLGDQKIDLVIKDSLVEQSEFYKIIEKELIPL